MSREIALFLTAAPTTDLDVGQVVAAARNSCPPNVAMSRRQRIVVRSSHGRSVTVIYPTTGTCGVNTCFPRAVIRNFRGCLGRWSAALMAAVVCERTVRFPSCTILAKPQPEQRSTPGRRLVAT